MPAPTISNTVLNEFVEQLEATPVRPRTSVPGNWGWDEIVVEPNKEQVRQAGADTSDDKWTQEFKKAAENSLFIFSVGVMGRTYLTKRLHKPICNSLQQCPPFRKMRLLPRDHAKTSIVSHCLPIHITIQPKDGNQYVKNLPGTDCRILLAGEAEARATSNLRVIRSAFDNNELLRAMWPECCWEKATRQAPKWNDKELILPRETEFPDPTFRAIGVGGAITGARPNVLIKDDLVSLEAANSEIVMQSAIDWHNASRALMDEYEKSTGVESLEFIIGTRWAVFDLYQYIIDSDPTVDYDVRAIIEEGEIIWPERFDRARIKQLEKDNPGGMFYLLYMNSVADPELTDFSLELLRDFKFAKDGLGVWFEEDVRDSTIQERIKVPEVEVPREQTFRMDINRKLFGDPRKIDGAVRLRM